MIRVVVCCCQDDDRGFRTSPGTMQAGHCLRGTSARYQRIEQMKAAYPIEMLCAAFSASVEAGFISGWSASKPRALAGARICFWLKRLMHLRSRGTYGTPRLQAELKEAGRRHGRKQIDRIRRELGLCGRQRRRYRPRTTDRSHEQPIAPNRLAGLAEATRPSCLKISTTNYQAMNSMACGGKALFRRKSDSHLFRNAKRRSSRETE
jgi:hypothetical protein